MWKIRNLSKQKDEKEVKKWEKKKKKNRKGIKKGKETEKLFDEKKCNKTDK